MAPASITDDDLEQEVEEDFGVQTLPAGADFIMCYSVAEGEVVPIDGEPSLYSGMLSSQHSIFGFLW